MKIEKDAAGNYSKEMPVAVSELAPRTLRIVGSDETEDRSGDVILAEGWEVANYLKNPIVLWAHDSSMPPIGKAKAVRVNKRDKRLEFDVYFPTINELSTEGQPPSEHALFVDTIYNMYKGGFLSAVSVGFKGKKAVENVGTAYGLRFLEQELLELSLVPVPANPNALVSAKSAGILIERIKGVIPMVEKSGARLSKSSREKLEAMHAMHSKLAADLRAFLDEDMGEEEEGCTGPKKEAEVEEEKAEEADAVLFLAGSPVIEI